MTVYHCFFEQSGTFKTEFKKLGYEAVDYDILNDFNQTDVVVDLFNEIEKAYNEESSLFDEIGKDDMILAFFPCVRFEDQSIINLRGFNGGMNNYSLEDKLLYGLKCHNELNYLYNILNKFVIVCLRLSIPLVIENPYSGQHYLRRYWHLQPTLIDYDRHANGDYYKKPTMYYFINCEPKDNVVFEPIKIIPKKIIEKERNQVQRSMIHPQYARRFIKSYILSSEGANFGTPDKESLEI